MTADTNIDPPTSKPTFVAKTRIGTGSTARYDRIGVAFEKEDGSLWVKLAGTQVVSDFALYKIEDEQR